MDTKQKEAVEILAQGREAVLATLEDGKPFTSAVNYFYAPGQKFGKAVISMSGLARHTKNAKKNPDVSLQVLESSEVPLYQRRRVSAQGRLVELTDGQISGAYKTEYLRFFPESSIFFQLPDFHFYELEISELYFIGGFGKIGSIR